MTKTWKIGYRFDDKTGAKKPWEVINRVFVDGKMVNSVRWGSFKTEEAAAKSIPASIERCKTSAAWGETELENIGRIER